MEVVWWGGAASPSLKNKACYLNAERCRLCDQHNHICEKCWLKNGMPSNSSVWPRWWPAWGGSARLLWQCSSTCYWGLHLLNCQYASFLQTSIFQSSKLFALVEKSWQVLNGHDPHLYFPYSFSLLKPQKLHSQIKCFIVFASIKNETKCGETPAVQHS